MFLYNNKIQKTLDFDNHVAKTISNTDQILLWDSGIDIFNDIKNKYAFAPQKMYTHEGERKEIFTKAKEKDSHQQTVSLNFFGNNPTEVDFEIIHRKDIYHISRTIVQKTIQKNITLEYDLGLKVLYIYWKLPITFELTTSKWDEACSLINLHKLKVIICKIINPKALDFIQLNNLSRAIKNTATKPLPESCELLITVSDSSTYQKTQFILNQGPFPSHHALTMREAYFIAKTFVQPQRIELARLFRSNCNLN